MKYYYVNTDSRARDDKRTCDIWFDRSMAFAGDHIDEKCHHAGLFARLGFGDVIFAYESEAGFVGIGVVDEEKWDGSVYEDTKRWLYKDDLVYEYRVKVRWLQDWRSNPQSAKSLKLPATPYYYCEINSNKYQVKELFAKISKGKR